MTEARDDANWRQLVEDIRIEIARDLRIDEKRDMIVRLRLDGRDPDDREKRVVSRFVARVGPHAGTG